MNWKYCAIAPLLTATTTLLTALPSAASTPQPNIIPANSVTTQVSSLQATKQAWVAPKNIVSEAAVLRLTPTKQKTATGERLLNLDLIINGKVVQQIQAVSGKPDVQNFRLGQNSKAGSREPLPQGIYRIGTVDRGAGLPFAMGDTFIPVTPLFATARSGIGIHRDADRHLPGGAGTIGCLGILNQQGIRDVAHFVTTYRPKTLIVDYGLSQATIAVK